MELARILITEDEVLIAREIEMTLQELGYTVTGIAANGQAALDQIAATQPDVVLMDIVMPGDADGIETANRIRTQFRLPIVFLTAYADADTLQRAKITEPFGYVLKPFQPQELNIAIQIALVRHRAEQFHLETLRSNISAVLPHEINTPLHSILGFIDVLLRYHNTMSATEILETLQCMREVAQKLERGCQNALLYTKLEVIATDPVRIGQLQQQETPFTPDPIENTAEKTARDFNRIADLRLDLQDLPVRMAEVYLRKIVAELVNNALQFSEPGTLIWVRSYLEEQKFCLAIGDHGRGMTADQITRVGAYMQFERQMFEQPGLGLGLSLVQQLVRLHGGNVAIHSQINQGTTATVRLPMPII
ncbi:response regulator [Leptolyngbya sp. NK1-12]|uniref:histidine kinase n=1 Tax=Leptolyngbya sp. NK1-12 TaxID=2547451 RepID=A0AA96WCS1_9CYAN|nr:response regulator [Leptolyngbya sp. NK1-12]